MHTSGSNLAVTVFMRIYASLLHLDPACQALHFRRRVDGQGKLAGGKGHGELGTCHESVDGKVRLAGGVDEAACDLV